MKKCMFSSIGLQTKDKMLTRVNKRFLVHFLLKSGLQYVPLHDLVTRVVEFKRGIRLNQIYSKSCCEEIP